MKAVREIEKRYYKYTLEPFSMPSFTSNNGWGTVYNSENSDNAYYIFDNPSSGGSRYSKYTGGGRIPIDWYWDCPDYLQLTSVFYWGQTYSDTSYATNSLTIYGWDYEANDWKQLGYQANTWESDYTNYDVACEELLTNKFKFTVVFKNINDYFPSTLTELVPKGYKRVSVKSTIGDYDYYRDELVYKLPKKIERKYYKYVIGSKLPKLSSNGSLGGNTPATNASSTHGSWDGQPWRAFDGVGGNNDNGWANNNVAVPQWIQYYTPNAFMLSKCIITNRNSRWKTFIVQGSNNGSDYINLQDFTVNDVPAGSSFEVVIDLQNRGIYHYYRFYVTAIYSTSAMCDVREIDLYDTLSIESIQDDYDYYIDIPVYHAINN